MCSKSKRMCKQTKTFLNCAVRINSFNAISRYLDFFFLLFFCSNIWWGLKMILKVNRTFSCFFFQTYFSFGHQNIQQPPPPSKKTYSYVCGSKRNKLQGGPYITANLYCILWSEHETYAQADALHICGNIWNAQHKLLILSAQ